MSRNLEVLMKSHEAVTRTVLPKGNPVVIRVDGKAFHTFTNGMTKPLDGCVTEAMLAATKYLCANIQNCRLGYVQSDEISLLLVDYAHPEVGQWFGGVVQKMASVAASMATLAFNEAFRTAVATRVASGDLPPDCVHTRRVGTALFDARVFQVPVDDVNSYFDWRQGDCARNSIEAFGRSRFSQRMMNRKPCKAIKQMLLDDGLDWEAESSQVRLGHVVVREVYDLNDGLGTKRSRWTAFDETPRFARTTIVDDFAKVGPHAASD